MNSREQFEAEISTSPYERSVARWPDLPVKYAWPGGYKDLSVDLAWCMWQAARKHALQQAYDAMFDIKGDKATRFDAQTAIRQLANPEGEP